MPLRRARRRDSAAVAAATAIWSPPPPGSGSSSDDATAPAERWPTTTARWASRSAAATISGCRCGPAVDQHCHRQLARAKPTRGELVRLVAALVELVHRARRLGQKPAEQLVRGLHAAAAVVAQVEHQSVSRPAHPARPGDGRGRPGARSRWAGSVPEITKSARRRYPTLASQQARFERRKVVRAADEGDRLGPVAAIDGQVDGGPAWPGERGGEGRHVGARQILAVGADDHVAWLHAARVRPGRPGALR